MGNEYVVAVVAIVFGTVFTGFVFYLIVGMIKTWINRNKSAYDDAAFNRMANAFINHKKETERRLQNLETIVTGEEEFEAGTEELGKPQESIEIESKERQKENKQNNSGNLRNMLKE